MRVGSARRLVPIVVGGLVVHAVTGIIAGIAEIAPDVVAGVADLVRDALVAVGLAPGLLARVLEVAGALLDVVHDLASCADVRGPGRRSWTHRRRPGLSGRSPGNGPDYRRPCIPDLPSGAVRRSRSSSTGRPENSRTAGPAGSGPSPRLARGPAARAIGSRRRRGGRGRTRPIRASLRTAGRRT